jgi:tryptophan-rich sensory protein
MITDPEIASWYAALVKPALNPPAWIFSPVWTVLYLMMAVALVLVGKNYFLIRGNKPMVRRWRWAIFFFFVQLGLNALWSLIFFGSTSLTINGLNNIGIAFIEIIFLWFAIVATIITFARISKLAAWLLVPYLLWVSFATYLNYVIWLLN